MEDMIKGRSGQQILKIAQQTQDACPRCQSKSITLLNAMLTLPHPAIPHSRLSQLCSATDELTLLKKGSYRVTERYPVSIFYSPLLRYTKGERLASQRRGPKFRSPYYTMLFHDKKCLNQFLCCGFSHIFIHKHRFAFLQEQYNIS